MTVGDVLRLLGLAGDRPFWSLSAMFLQDTAQAGSEVVLVATAASCLQAHRIGMRSRPVGGMAARTEEIGTWFEALGGDLRSGTIVERIATSHGGSGSGTRVGTRGRGRQGGKVRADF